MIFTKTSPVSEVSVIIFKLQKYIFFGILIKLSRSLETSVHHF